MPSPINATAISSSLAVTLQRQLAARGIILTSTVCEQIVAAQLDGIAAVAIEEARAFWRSRPKLRLVETDGPRA